MGSVSDTLQTISLSAALLQMLMWAAFATSLATPTTTMTSIQYIENWNWGTLLICNVSPCQLKYKLKDISPFWKDNLDDARYSFQKGYISLLSKYFKIMLKHVNSDGLSNIFQ